MRPFFSLHAGEYLVAAYVERYFKRVETCGCRAGHGRGSACDRPATPSHRGAQVKYSKDFS
jgi:hypothetical protein